MDINLKRSKIKILKELIRKSWHFFAGLALVVGYTMIRLYWSEDLANIVLVGVILAGMIFEHVRLTYRPRIFRVLDALFRRREYNKPSALLPFLLGTTVVFAVFDHWIAFTALMMLIVGDSASAAFGMMFGKKKIKGSKTYIGTFAGLVANLATGAVLMIEYPLVFIPMAITATAVEALTIKIEDNLTVPIAAAFAGYLATIIFSISLTIS